MNFSRRKRGSFEFPVLPSVGFFFLSCFSKSVAFFASSPDLISFPFLSSLRKESFGIVSRIEKLVKSYPGSCCKVAPRFDGSRERTLLRAPRIDRPTLTAVSATTWLSNYNYTRPCIVAPAALLIEPRFVCANIAVE